MRSAPRFRSATFRLVLDALFAAMYVVLATLLTIKTPITEVSLSTLPLLIAGFLFGPADGAIIAIVGSFLEQCMSPYGLSISTVLWMLPPILSALTSGLLGLLVKKAPLGSRRHTVLLVICTFLAEMLCTAANTATLYLDGAIVGYSVKALNLILPIRLANLALRALVTCIVVPLLLPRVQKLMLKRNLA